MKTSNFTVLVAALSLCFNGLISAQTLTKDNGAPIGDNQNSQTAGPNGPILLQEWQLLHSD